MSALLRRIREVSPGNFAAVVVVFVAFAVTYATFLADRRSGQTTPYSATALVLATVCGVIYLWLIVREWAIKATKRRLLFGYFVLTSLVVAIHSLLAGATIIWLVAMPLVAGATMDLPRLPRYLVYIATIVSVALPVYLRYGNWQAPLFTFMIFLTAFIFVVAFAKLMQAAEIARLEAQQLAAELADANRRLSKFAVQAEELAIIQERNRLAREIHDNLGHYLTVANVQIKAAQALLAQDPARANAALEKAGQLTQEGLTAVRQSVSTLRDSPLGNRTLPEAIAHLAAETHAAGIVTELRVTGEAVALDPRAELTLFRAAQEGLTNARRHAHASRVDLTLDYSDPAVVSLTVRDNGVGHSAPETASGFGLLGIEERAHLLNGRVAIESTPGAGYSLTVELPRALTETAESRQGVA